MVWVFGLFPCGTYSDVNIFRLGLKKLLRIDEHVLTDGGYQSERCLSRAWFQNSGRSKFYGVVRAKHELPIGGLSSFMLFRIASDTYHIFIRSVFTHPII